MRDIPIKKEGDYFCNHLDTSRIKNINILLIINKKKGDFKMFIIDIEEFNASVLADLDKEVYGKASSDHKLSKHKKNNNKNMFFYLSSMDRVFNKIMDKKKFGGNEGKKHAGIRKLNKNTKRPSLKYKHRYIVNWAKLEQEFADAETYFVG